MALKTVLLGALLVVMVIVGLLQTVQILNLSTALNSGVGLVTAKPASISVAGATANSIKSTGSATSLDNLPGMVGGC